MSVSTGNMIARAYASKERHGLALTFCGQGQQFMETRSDPTTRRTKVHRFASAIRTRLRPLSALDNWHGPLAWCEDLIIIAAAIGLYATNSWFLPVSWILIGTRQRALATLLHEASHATLCRNRVLNFVFGTPIAGWPIFQVFYRYQTSHVREHHAYLGNKNIDPDIKNYLSQRLSECRDGSSLRRHFFLTLAGFSIPSNLKCLFRDRLLPANWSQLPRQNKLEYVGFTGFWILAITTCCHAGLLAEFVLLWLVPYFTTFQGVNWIIEIAEHYPIWQSPPAIIPDDEVQMTRNRRGHWVESFFTGIHGENWHLVHHLRPEIPFWNLERAHELLLDDHEYSAADGKSGGIFTCGSRGAPSFFSLLGRVERPRSAERLSACSEICLPTVSITERRGAVAIRR
jgi:fatty acid desaturase